MLYSLMVPVRDMHRSSCRVGLTTFTAPGVTPPSCMAMLGILRTAFLNWRIELKPGSAVFSEPRGRTPISNMAPDFCMVFNCLGNPIDNDGSSTSALLLCLNRTRATVFANFSEPPFPLPFCGEALSNPPACDFPVFFDFLLLCQNRANGSF